MTRQVLKHSISIMMLGLAFVFLLANWTITGTQANTGIEKPTAQTSLGNNVQLSASHTVFSDVPLATAHQSSVSRPASLAGRDTLHLASEIFSLNPSTLPAFTPQAGQGDKPVEQTRKNIQVLKGLPESQLFPVMNFFNTSLGVNCAFCHVRTGEKWEFEKDDREEKVTARRMIQMQFDINKNNKALFDGGAITCFTCHGGQTRPMVTPRLPLAMPAPPPGGAPAATSSAPTMTVDQVLDRYIQAQGGRAAIEKFKTRVIKGTQIVANGASLPIEVYEEAPNKFASVMTTPKNGTFYTGFNGTTGWSKNQQNGQQEITGAQLDQLKRAADFYSDLHFKELYPTLRLTRKEKIGDRETYVLTSKTTDTLTEKFYFDTETGLLVRILSIMQTMLAPLPSQTDFSDYREVDGVKYPFTVQQSFVDIRNGWTRKYTEIKHNVPIDEAIFNPPPASK